MKPDALPGPMSTYVVVIRDPIVAQDVAGAIAHLDPSARILVAAMNPHEAVGLLGDVTAVAVAVLEADPRTLRATTFGAALEARGARIILIGDAAEEAGEAGDYRVLMRPFGNEALLAVLRLARARCS